MPADLLWLAPLLWIASMAALLAPGRLGPALARILLAAGCAAGMAGAVLALPAGAGPWRLPTELADMPVFFRLAPDALWLLFFGLAPAGLACALTPPRTRQPKLWLLAAALTLLGALGVFGLQDAMSFLIAWEVMSLGGAALLLAENPSHRAGHGALFMLGLLEVGSVALLLAMLLLGRTSGPAFTVWGAGGVGAGLLLLAGFGAKLGLLPFYEWFPSVYGAASGATGVLLSGIVLNAAYFALARGFLDWLPQHGEATLSVGAVTLAIAVATAALAALYALQQDDWRRLCSLSTAENAALAVAALGAGLMFRAYGRMELAGLAITVALIQMAAHSLAKGGALLTADAVYLQTGGYRLRQSGLVRNAPAALGVGALFAVMSLAAMPPQSGFVAEWYLFETVFQGFHLPTLFGRLAMALAGAGIALTAAVALAAWVKLFGVGLLGSGKPEPRRIGRARAGSVLALGVGVLGLAVGMPWWLGALGSVSQAAFGVNAAASMRTGWILVPLTANFAFISPTLLVIVGPLLALLPLVLLWRSWTSQGSRQVPVWYGGLQPDPAQSATTALTFSNALRTYYRFVYNPTHETVPDYAQAPYFIRRLRFTEKVAPIFGPGLFAPAVRAVRAAARAIRGLQSGRLNLYAGWIGLVLLAILILTTLRE